MIDSFYLLDLRTANKIVLSTYPMLATCCLDTYIKIGDMDVLLKRGQDIKKRFSISDEEYKRIYQAIKSGVIPKGLVLV